MKKKPVRWLWRNLRQRRLALLLMTAAHVGNALLGVAFALGSQSVIDHAVAGEREQFFRACLVQLGIILGIVATLTLYRHLNEKLHAQMDRDWKKRLLHVLLGGDYACVKEYHSGELVNRLTNDVRIVNDGVLSILPGFAGMLTRLIAAAVVLIKLQPLFGLLLLVIGAMVGLFTALLRYRLKELHRKVSEAEGQVSGLLQESMEKLLVVQAMDVSGEMERRADVLMGRRYEIQRRRKNFSLFANTCVSLLTYLAGFVALVWCSVGLLHGQMTFGSLTAVTHLVSQLQGPFVNLSGVIPKYIAMVAAAERLMELDALEVQDVPALDAEVLYKDMTALGAQGLRFSYGRDTLLTDGNFTLPKGAFGVIIGQSGIGKSTLLKLLLGVFSPEAGSLYVQLEQGKVALDRSTRRLFAYVPQGNLVFSGTLRENLLVTCPNAGEAEIAEALYVSGMKEFLPGLPQGLDTVLGENGTGLSEGQVQRLAIARAILGGAPVLLLDEATSALDEELEKTVLERIRALPNRTCIAVTHRPAAQAIADFRLEVVDRKIICTENKGA